MKKGILVLVIVFLTSSTIHSHANAATESQAMDGKPALCSLLSYGVAGGLTLFNQYNKFNGESNNDNNYSRLGFHVAGTALYPITAAFYMLVMLDFSLKGTTYKHSNEYTESKNRLSLYYLQLPILFAYNVAVISAYTISVLAGPYVATGLFGNYNYEHTTSGQSDSDKRKVDFGKDNDLRRADFGLMFGAMVVRSMWTFSVMYELGLKNIHPTDNNDASRKNGGLNFTVGYRFNSSGK